MGSQGYEYVKTSRHNLKRRLLYVLDGYGDDLYKNENFNTALSNVDIDDFILGYWKLESTFKRGKFLRQKCYIEK